MSINPTPVIPRSTQGHLLRGAKRRGNPFLARHRRADGTSGTPSPTERFAALRAGRGSEFHPARGIPKRNTTQRAVFLYFSRSAQQNRRGSNSLPGIPRMAEPFAGALPSPLDLTRCALVEAASSILPATFQKENTILTDGVSFWSGRRGSNSLPRPWQGRALPDELRPQTQDRLYLSSQRLSTPFSQFPQNLMPALAGGHAGIYRMMISTTPGLSALG